MQKHIEIFKMTGIELIAKERNSQIVDHGYTVEKDYERWKNGELLVFARHIILAESDKQLDKITTPEVLWHIFTKPREEQLAVAGALVAAHIELIQYTKKVEQLKQEKNNL
jgi:hypothetical protein